MVSWGGLGGLAPLRNLRYPCLAPREGLGGFAPQESPLITRALPPQRPCLAPVPCPQFFFSSEFFRPNFFRPNFFRPMFFRPSLVRRPSSVVRKIFSAMYCLSNLFRSSIRSDPKKFLVTASHPMILTSPQWALGQCAV